MRERNGRKEPLSQKHGIGFAALVPLPGCMSDAKTLEEALGSVRDAIVTRSKPR